MVPFGQTLIDVCPVPSCYDEQGYFEVVDGGLVRGQIAANEKLVVAGERGECFPRQGRTLATFSAALFRTLKERIGHKRRGLHHISSCLPCIKDHFRVCTGRPQTVVQICRHVPQWQGRPSIRGCPQGNPDRYQSTCATCFLPFSRALEARN